MVMIAGGLLHPLQAIDPDLKADMDARIREFRTSDFTIRLRDAEGRPLQDHPVTVTLQQHAFTFGTAVSAKALKRQDAPGDIYRTFILNHFNGLVAENAMKWPQCEPEPGRLEYSDADLILAFAREHQLALRGHCLFWSKEKWQSDWVRNLSPAALREAVTRRIQQLLDRYADVIRDWDMNNEMIHGRFFRDHLGEEIRPWMFQEAQRLAPQARLFTNEYSIVDSEANTEAYLTHIRELQEAGAPVGAIGIQEHAAERFAGARGTGHEVERGAQGLIDSRAVWRRLDRLAETGLPIHITEVSFKTRDERAKADALEAFYRTAFAHPAVEAFYLWGFWEEAHWLGAEAALVRRDGSLTPAADRLRHLLLEEWTTQASGTTDEQGVFTFQGFYGTYEITAGDLTQEIALTHPRHRAELVVEPTP